MKIHCLVWLMLIHGNHFQDMPVIQMCEKQTVIFTGDGEKSVNMSGPQSSSPDLDIWDSYFCQCEIRATSTDPESESRLTVTVIEGNLCPYSECLERLQVSVVDTNSSYDSCLSEPHNTLRARKESQLMTTPDISTSSGETQGTTSLSASTTETSAVVTSSATDHTTPGTCSDITGDTLLSENLTPSRYGMVNFFKQRGGSADGEFHLNITIQDSQQIIVSCEQRQVIELPSETSENPSFTTVTGTTTPIYSWPDKLSVMTAVLSVIAVIGIITILSVLLCRERKDSCRITKAGKSADKPAVVQSPSERKLDIESAPDSVKPGFLAENMMDSAVASAAIYSYPSKEMDKATSDRDMATEIVDNATYGAGDFNFQPAPQYMEATDLVENANYAERWSNPHPNTAGQPESETHHPSPAESTSSSMNRTKHAQQKPKPADRHRRESNVAPIVSPGKHAREDQHHRPEGNLTPTSQVPNQSTAQLGNKPLHKATIMPPKINKYKKTADQCSGPKELRTRETDNTPHGRPKQPSPKSTMTKLGDPDDQGSSKLKYNPPSQTKQKVEHLYHDFERSDPDQMTKEEREDQEILHTYYNMDDLSASESKGRNFPVTAMSEPPLSDNPLPLEPRKNQGRTPRILQETAGPYNYVDITVNKK